MIELVPPPPQVPPEVAARLRALDSLRVEVARRDVNVFCEYVLQDERTSESIRQAWPHRRWHELADLHDRLLIWAHVDSGKTAQMAVARTLFELGQNPELRYAVVSNTHRQAEKVLSLVSRYIRHSARLHRVFPNLRPGLPWTQNAVTVQRRTLAKDPTIQALGVHGNVLGSRLDRLILDDVLDYENTLTPLQRRGTIDWFDSSLTGRLVQGARILCIGTAWHPEDLLHELARRWTAGSPDCAVRFPVIDDDPKSATFQQSFWPEHWPMSRIEERRRESTPIEFSRQMLCLARDDEHARFKREYVERALKAGSGRKTRSLGFPEGLPPGCKTYTGVDLAVSPKESADLTVLFTVLVHPKGSTLGEGAREVVDVESGRWSGPEIVDRIAAAHRRHHSIVWVENNASQDFIVQFTRERASYVPVRPFTTGRNKAHPEFGVEALATEMRNGLWVIPNDAGRTTPEVGRWIDEMLHYDPAGHTGDRLMASWFAREAARAGAVSVQPVKVATMRR